MFSRWWSIRVCSHTLQSRDVACWDFLCAQLDKEILDKPHSVFFPSLRRSSPISGMYSVLYMWQEPLTRADSESRKSASLAFASSGSWMRRLSRRGTSVQECETFVIAEDAWPSDLRTDFKVSWRHFGKFEFMLLEFLINYMYYSKLKL